MIVGFKKGKLIMITKEIRMVPKTYYIVDGYEFDGEVLFEILDSIDACDCSSIIGDYYPDETRLLVHLGYLESYGGGSVYFDNNGKAKELFDEMLKL